MRKTSKKKLAEDVLVPKTVGVPMTVEDLEALGRYRDGEGRRTLVRPKEGPAAAAVFRAGLRQLGIAGAP